MRSEARELAFKLIFERLFVKNDYLTDEEFFSSLKREEDKVFSKELINKFIENKDEIFDLISSHLIGYSIERVYKIDLSLISLALVEILYLNTPGKVAINECLELSKRYSTVKSSKFINGVLSAILKDLNLKSEEQ